MNVLNWLHRRSISVPQPTGSFNLDKLDASAALLKDTVADVASTAASTAKALADKYHSEEMQMVNQRTKACFHALNSASDVIVILDSIGDIFFCNDMFITAFKQPNYTSCVGRPLEDVVGKLPKRVWNLIQSNKIWKGTSGDYDISIIPIMNGEPKPIYYTCTFKKIN